MQRPTFAGILHLLLVANVQRKKDCLGFQRIPEICHSDTVSALLEQMLDKMPSQETSATNDKTLGLLPPQGSWEVVHQGGKRHEGEWLAGTRLTPLLSVFAHQLFKFFRRRRAGPFRGVHDV